jgi:MYXO-CTERM domain-containing protein
MMKMLGHGLMMALALGVSGTAFAQECSDDTDCGEGMRCDEPLVLSPECEPPCEAEPSPEPVGRCVDESLDQACLQDADCGDGLECVRLLVASSCPEGAEDCVPTEEEGEGFCAEPGSDADLAATSGLAPEPLPTGSGVAGGAAPEIAEAGVAPGEESDDAASGGESSGGCSVTAANPAHLSTLAPLGIALLWLRRRRAMA